MVRGWRYTKPSLASAPLMLRACLHVPFIRCMYGFPKRLCTLRILFGICLLCFFL